jgi:hypothetical protein
MPVRVRQNPAYLTLNIWFVEEKDRPQAAFQIAELTS